MAKVVVIGGVAGELSAAARLKAFGKPKLLC